jgi:hypothetical protein
MPQLDPIFAEALRPCIEPAPAGYYNSAAWIRDEIAGLEGDIEAWQETIERNAVEIPRMQLESLKCERDVAVTNLKIYELRLRLAEKLAGKGGVQ